MKSKKKHYLLLVVPIALIFSYGFFGGESTGQEKKTKQPQRETSKQYDGPKISDAAHSITFGKNGDGALCHESLDVSSGRFYLGPTFLFKRRADGLSVVQNTSININGKTQINADIEFIRDAGRLAAAQELSQIKEKKILPIHIENLPITSANVRLSPKSTESYYGFTSEKFADNNSNIGIWPIVFEVDSEKAQEFTENVNNGKVTFVFTYTYNGIALDSDQISIRFKRNRSAEKIRELSGQGRYLVTSKQIANASDFIQNEIYIEHIKPLGEIASDNFDILKMFTDLKTNWLSDVEHQEEYRSRLWKEAKIDSSGVLLKDFRPIEITIKVRDIMKTKNTTKAKQKQYYDAYRTKKDEWKQTAGTSAKWIGFGEYGGGADGSYEQIVESKVKNTSMTEKEFDKFVQTYHAVEYDDVSLKWRGIELYDLQNIKGKNESVLTQVTYLPKLINSYKSRRLRPGLNNYVIPLPTIQEDISAIKNSIIGIEKKLAQSQKTLAQHNELLNVGILKNLRRKVDGKPLFQVRRQRSGGKLFYFSAPNFHAGNMITAGGGMIAEGGTPSKGKRQDMLDQK